MVRLSAKEDKQIPRQCGIDVLKSLSMFMVVMLHIIGHGGLLDSIVNGTVNYYVTWLVEIASISAVNIFAITTGYLMVNKSFKSSGIIGLWIRGVFYSALITVVFIIAFPGTVGIKQILQVFLPISSNCWWYFSCYFVMCLLMPFINKMLAAITKRQSLLLVAAIFLISTITTFIPLDAFSLQGGYSPLWIVCLYVIGAVINKHNLFANTKKRWFAVAYVCTIALVFLSRMAIQLVTKAILGREFATDLLLGYVSPITVIMACSLLLCLRSVRTDRSIGKVFGFIAPLSFAVYLISDHPLIRSQFIDGRFAYLSEENVIVLLSTLILLSILIFISCTAMDFLRSILFNVTKLNGIIQKVSEFVDEKINFGD